MTEHETIYLDVELATINIPRKVGALNWGRCMSRAMKVSTVFGVNECFWTKQRTLYRRMARRNGWGYSGVNTPNPIFWDKAVWSFVRKRIIVLHEASTGSLARRFPGFNARREATLVVLEHRETGQRVSFLCSHWVPDGNKVPAAWRLIMRRRSKKIIAEVMRRQVASGRPVFFVADTNIAKAFKMAIERFQWVWGKTIDKIGVATPEGTSVTSVRSSMFSAPTDHRHGIRSTTRLRVRRPKR